MYSDRSVGILITDLYGSNVILCMHRRKYLSVFGSTALGSLAGCINPNSFQSLGDEIEADVSTFTVQSFDIQQSVAYRGTVHQRIRNDQDTQYLIFGIDVEDEVEAVSRQLYDRFTLSLGGRIIEEIGRPRMATQNQSELERDMYLMYDVPRDTNINQGVLEFSDLNEVREWSIEEAVNNENLSQYVQNPPQPVVESFSAPESVPSDRDEIAVGVTVSDGSDELSVREPLKLLISSTDISGSTAYTAPITTGKTTTYQFEVNAYPEVGPNTETLRLNWGQDSLSREVKIEET